MTVLPTGHILDHMIGDLVYLITDVDQKIRIVNGISLRPNGAVAYSLACGAVENWHFNIEISTEKTIF